MIYKKGTSLHSYILKTDFESAGQSQWAFAEKNGRQFFVKRFMSPTYPVTESDLPEKDKKYQRQQCEIFENRHRQIMDKLKNKTIEGGNLVVAHEFFREGAHFYKTTEKIEHLNMLPSSLEFSKKILLLKTIAFSLSLLHSIDVVHGDLKPDNILLKKTKTQWIAGKIIDFDSSYFSGNPPAPDEYIGEVGIYSAPEVLQYNWKEITHPGVLTQKADIFALGLIFSLFLIGVLPNYDTKTFTSPSLAVMAGRRLKFEAKGIPNWLNDLINQMLLFEASSRPSCEQVLETLDKEKSPNINNLKGDLAHLYDDSNPPVSLKGTALSKK